MQGHNDALGLGPGEDGSVLLDGAPGTLIVTDQVAREAARAG